MAKSYSAQERKSTGETTYQQGTDQPATLAETSPLTDPLLTDENIEIEFTDDSYPSLDDLTPADSISLTMNNTDEPLVLDDPDDEQSFYWPLPRDLTDLEENVFLNYFVPTWPPTIAQPPAFHVIQSLGMWREEVTPLVTAVAKILDEMDIDDSESSAPYDDIDSIRAILKTVKRSFSDFSTLHKIAWDVLANDYELREQKP